jgi:hypothetical protein
LTGGTGIYTKVTGAGQYHWFRNRVTGVLTAAYSGKLKLHDRDDD